MKKEWVKWFLSYVSNKTFEVENTPYFRIKRNYQYYNIKTSEVPFHKEFFNYLVEFTKTDDFNFDFYHIHKWSVGNFFSSHIDNRDNRKFAYVCELQESNCKTKLLVEGKPIDESWFNVHTRHEVPKIKDGERVSLTIFGKNKQVTKGVI